ncbi:MAG: hypothetical protein U1A78_39835 [Polyangia bacterium]
MRKSAFYTLGLLAGVSLSCGTDINSGIDPNCPAGQVCDPSNPTDPNQKPDTVVGVGPGSGGSGGGGTPFDPNANGSSGVKTDPNGNIILDPMGSIGSSSSFIWVSTTGNGSIAKVDVRTMKQVARYNTAPGAAADPSRTTVSLNGDVVVANRAWNSYGSQASRASAVMIAGDKSGCIDRNGNGKIDTFEGEGALPAAFQWPANQKDSPDECVLWLTPLNTNPDGTPRNTDPGTRPRAAGFDGEIGPDGQLSRYVYIGLYDTKEVVRLDAKTGAVVKRISVAPAEPYGLVIDKQSNVWVAGRGTANYLAKIATKSNDAVRVYGANNDGKLSPCDNYGITADARGLIYIAPVSGSALCRFNPTTESWETLTATGVPALRGVAVDQNNQLWAAGHDSSNMLHVDVSANPPAAGGMTTMVKKEIVALPGAGTVAGAAIDFDNNVWGVSYTGGAFKIEPASANKLTMMNPGAATYTYSDMTGYQLRNASRNGTFRHIFTGCGEGTKWTTLTYQASSPPGTKFSIRYRAAVSIADLAAAPWTTASATSPQAIMLPAGTKQNYLQVEVNMSTVDANVSPVLSGLSAAFQCNNIVG